jgi:peptidoglycan hydrolase-like protein with peptidoglycan-binding domain
MVGRAASASATLPVSTARELSTARPVRARPTPPAALARDLTDIQIWELSLGRSRARRRAAELRFVPTGSRAKRLSIGTLAALSLGPATGLGEATAAEGPRRLFAALPPTTSEHAVALQPGSSGAQVRKLQTALHVKADGNYGPETEDAVYLYQATHGLAVDGVVGPKTGAALASDSPTKKPSTGDAIRIAQAALGVQVDGEYGPETYEAIKAFQESHSINVDEVVGPQTWHALHISVDQTLSPPASAIPRPKVIPAVVESSGGGPVVEGAPEGAPPPAPQETGAPVARMASASDEGGGQAEGDGGTSAPQAAPAPEGGDGHSGGESQGGGGGESHSGGGEGEGGGGGEGSGTVRRVIAAGNEIATRPYVYGGGHGSFNSEGYDCSGSVSYALHGGGLINSPETSGELEHYGESGPGKHITIYANSEHAYMEVNGRRYDTVSLAEHGSRWSNSSGSDGGSFTVRHPAGQ